MKIARIIGPRCKKEMERQGTNGVSVGGNEGVEEGEEEEGRRKKEGL